MKNEKNIFKNKKWLFVSATVLSIASLSAIHPQDAKAATTTSGKDPEQGQVTDTKNNKNNVKNAKTSINFIAQKQVKTSAPINYAVKPDVTNTQSKDNVTTNEVNSQAPQDNTQNNKNSSQADQSVTPAVQAANTIKATYEEDPTTGKETASIPGASLSINHNKLDLIDDPNAGTINITFTVNSANAGDTFTINVPQDYGYTIGQMPGVGSLSVNQSNNNGTITITANSNINGAVILNAVITEANNSYRSAPTTPIDKLGTITQEITWSKNNTPIDKNLKFILYEDPASIVNINPIKGPDTNNGAIMANTDGVFTLNINGAVGLVKNDPNYTNWVYSGTNYGTTVTIPVPKGFILNQSLTKLYNNPKYYGTVTQEGDKLIVTVPKGTGTENYEGYPGLRIVGKFDVSAPDETETITADGNPTVSQNILYTNADGTTTMHTVTKSTTPWTVTILGDNPKNNSSVSVTGEQNNNQLILDPGAIVDPNPAIVNTVGFTNGSGLDLDNNNLPADQQAQLNITIPDGLVVNKISTPTSAMYLPGTTSYTYTLTLANGKTISGTVKAGDDIVNNNGVPIIKVVITPDYLSALATNVNNNKFQLYGKLSDTYYNGKDIKNGDTLSTTAEFNYSYYDNKNDKTMFEYSTGDDTQTVTGYTRGFSKEGIFSANGDSTYFGSDPIIAQAGQKINTGIFSTSQGNYDTVDEPIFYYVLPTDTYVDIDVDNVASNFSNNSLIEGNVPPPKFLHICQRMDYIKLLS